MARFSIPAGPGRSILDVDRFLGVDYTNSPANVDKSRSPNGQNMIRDVPGKVRKCMGYETIAQYPARINGVFARREDDGFLVHAGTKLYFTGGTQAGGTPEGTELFSGMADARSSAWQFGDKLYIIDGAGLTVFDGTAAGPVGDAAKIPLFTIAKAPAGGGTQYEELNLIQPKFTEQFLGTEEDTQYHLSFAELDDAPVKVEVLGADGAWQEKAEDTDYTVDRAAGIVTFTTAPGKSPVAGEDNVRITASRTVEGYAARIFGCTMGTLYGVNGAADRLFVSGNAQYRNYDWYSGMNDPTYWADTAYAVLGTQQSAIVGYSIVNERLATHKDNMEDGRNVIIREGNLVDGRPAFPIVNTLQGEGAIAPRSFAYLVNEPLFLTKLGVFAITAQDVTGEKYAQQRSFYLNGKLLEEPGLEDAVAVVFKDMYWLCLNGAAYILDGLQYSSTKNEPYSTRQYAGFYRTNMPARVLLVRDGRLWMGGEDGGLRRFFDDKNALTSYSDDGQAIHAVWETPDFSGKLFYKNKTFRFLAVRLASAIATSVRISGQRRGLWAQIKEDTTSARHFNWAYWNWDKFSWSNDETPKTLSTKVRIKKVDKARFRFENSEVNEPFGLFDFAVEFVENGNFKG